MTQVNEKKYNLTRDFKEKLKLFLMIVKPRMLPPVPEEKPICVVAYRAEDAVAESNRSFGNGENAIYYGGVFVLVEDIIKRINEVGGGVEAMPQSPLVLVPPPLGVEGFRSGLLMACDRFLEDEEDKKMIKGIINKLKDHVGLEKS